MGLFLKKVIYLPHGFGYYGLDVWTVTVRVFSVTVDVVRFIHLYRLSWSGESR